MLKLSKYSKLTFDQREYLDALKKLKSSYYIFSHEKIDEINRLAPSMALNNPRYGLTFDEAQYLDSILKLKKVYYMLPSKITDRIIALSKSI
jgi:hypothetical protein